MTTTTKILAGTLVALVISTSLAQAGIGGPVIDVTPTPQIDSPPLVDTGSPHIDAPVIDVGSPYIDGPVIDVPANIPIIKYQKGQTGKSAGIIVKLDLQVSCKVAGTPSEFPDDIKLTNLGDTLVAGTRIKWNVTSFGKGVVELGQDLASGKTVKVDGVLGGGVEAGRGCTAKVI